MAAQLGYCGLDRRRQPLVGDEIRPCWDAWPAGTAPESSIPLSIRPAATGGDGPARREFVEVVDSAAIDRTVARPAVESGEPGWSLWGEFEG